MLEFRSGLLPAALLLACGPAPASVAPPPPPTPASSATSATPAAAASSPEPLPELGARLSLLGGRLTMAGLPSSKLEARSHDVMSAETPDEVETRVVLVPGE